MRILPSTTNATPLRSGHILVLVAAKDSDLVVIRYLDVQLKEYKRKYEQAKTELRNVKDLLATPQLFLQASSTST